MLYFVGAKIFHTTSNGAPAAGTFPEPLPEPSGTRGNPGEPGNPRTHYLAIIALEPL